MREEKMRVLIVLPWWLWYFRFPRGLRRRLKIVTSIRVCSFENDFGSFAEGFHISFLVIFFSKEDRSFKKEKKESIIFLALFSLSLSSLFSFSLSLFPLFPSLSLSLSLSFLFDGSRFESSIPDPTTETEGASFGGVGQPDPGCVFFVPRGMPFCGDLG